MWDAIAGPVLTGLGYTDSPAEGRPWPRVWWCPVGVLARLPLHAAGHHIGSLTGRGRPRAVMDLAVSSYATTLRGLSYARAQRPQPSADPLIVAAPAVPGVPPLPGTRREVEVLSRLMSAAKGLAETAREAVMGAHPISGVT